MLHSAIQFQNPASLRTTNKVKMDWIFNAKRDQIIHAFLAGRFGTAALEISFMSNADLP